MIATSVLITKPKKIIAPADTDSNSRVKTIQSSIVTLKCKRFPRRVLYAVKF